MSASAPPDACRCHDLRQNICPHRNFNLSCCVCVCEVRVYVWPRKPFFDSVRPKSRGIHVFALPEIAFVRGRWFFLCPRPNIRRNLLFQHTNGRTEADLPLYAHSSNQIVNYPYKNQCFGRGRAYFLYQRPRTRLAKSMLYPKVRTIDIQTSDCPRKSKPTPSPAVFRFPYRFPGRRCAL
jgi:hypothetical protein